MESLGYRVDSHERIFLDRTLAQELVSMSISPHEQEELNYIGDHIGMRLGYLEPASQNPYTFFEDSPLLTRITIDNKPFLEIDESSLTSLLKRNSQGEDVVYHIKVKAPYHAIESTETLFENWIERYNHLPLTQKS